MDISRFSKKQTATQPKRPIRAIRPGTALSMPDTPSNTPRDASKQLNPPVQSETNATKTVEIKISMPSLPNLPSWKTITKTAKKTFNAVLHEVRHTLQPQLKRLLLRAKAMPRKARIQTGSALAVAVLLVVSFYLIKGHTANPDGAAGIAASAQGAAAPAKVATLSKGTPDYKTVLPTGKDIKQLGGWTRVSPPDKNAVFAYVDAIGPTSISVSEQPLPANFKKDTATQIDQLAQGFSATEKVTAGDTTVHIGTSAKGAQSIIFSKNNLLILIKSTAPVTNGQWAAYVSSLQ